MIFDLLAHADLYTFPNPLIRRGLDFLRSSRAASMPVGRMDIESDRLYAMKQEYPTRTDANCFWEAHRRFIDIQYLVDGVEDIAYAPISSLSVLEPYDEGRDFVKLAGTGTVLTVSAGMFAIFFPHDAHKPCMASRGVVAPVQKIVVKVAVES